MKPLFSQIVCRVLVSFQSSRVVRLFAAGAALSLLPSIAAAGTLYYDREANPGWFSGTGWSTTGVEGTFTQGWTDGNIAEIVGGTGTVTVNLGNNTATVTGLARSDGAITGFSNGTLNFDNGQISGTSLLRFSSNLTVVGDFTMAGSNTLDFVTTDSLYAGLGHVTINGGEFRMGWTSNEEISVTVASLAGSGGSISTRALAGNDDSPVQSFTVNQAINTTYSGTLSGTGISGAAVNYLQLTKSGNGHLTLDGTVDNLRQTTTVAGGGLYINSLNANFGDVQGNTAILVQSGGVLGGSGTITLGLADDSVVVEDGGGLVAGDRLAAGITTYSLSSGGSVDLSGATTASGWLHFNLGSDALAGDSYSQIVITGGSLNIGSGLLEFSDFNFTLLSGFGIGEYVLFDADEIVGSLGSSLTGSLGSYTGNLSQVGDEIHLTVVPEPVTASLLAGFIALLAARVLRSSARKPR